MKKTSLVILLLLTQTFFFAQDNKVMKIAKYINKGKWQDARELLDELDNNPKYKNDIDYWFVRTCYYRDAVTTHINSDKELYKIEIVEAKKSFEKLFELDKTDSSKAYSSFIPQIKKEIYNGQNETIDNSSNKVQSESSKPEEKGKTVTLTEIGQGKTKDAAKYNALRNALENAFGTFISSNTTIFKDELAKDEIVSISSGNIQSYEILSETLMPDGSYTNVVKATVSIGKLTSFCESKGIAVEFKGGLFAANIKLQELNRENEEAVMTHLIIILNEIVAKGFDFKIDVNEPTKTYSEKWSVKYTVTAKANSNLGKINDIILNTINNICLNPQEIATYSNQNLSTYRVVVNNKEYCFRASYSLMILKEIFEKNIPLASIRFSVSDGLNTSNFFSPTKTSMKIEYYILLTHGHGNFDFGPDTIHIADYLRSVKDSNFQQVYNSTYTYNSGNGSLIINLGQLNKIDENYKSAFGSESELAFKYEFTNTYTMEQISKLTEFKVQPLN
jgi:hypothetical protein